MACDLQSGRQWTPRGVEHGPGTIYAGFPSVLGLGVRGPLRSNFLESTVNFQNIKMMAVNHRSISRGQNSLQGDWIGIM